MSVKLNGTALLKRLVSMKDDPQHGPNAKIYLGTIEQLLEILPGVLGRISSTFPHYTSHAIDHSTRIVDRVGRVLPLNTLANLSPTEIYIIIAGALLHDIGMVAREQEYSQIETLASFKALGDDPRFAQYFDAAQEAIEAGDFWAAAFNRRFLIAEWIRRQHADRAAAFILNPPGELDVALCDDERLRHALARVCAAHGLRNRLRLEDAREFPRAALIRDDIVDLAFCAVLLRLGDLLDLDHERACPVVQRLVEPLPSDSASHWGRHRAITLLTVTPQRVELEARCATQEEHALLYSWCQWLREETVYCSAIAATSDRLTMTLAPATFDIQPKNCDDYEFRQYRFEIDQEEVFDSLFGKRLYGNECLFLRELLQNAIDATRCKIMSDLENGRWERDSEGGDSEKQPLEPRDLPWHIRKQYPIRLHLAIHNGHWCVTVDDCGIGMDHEVIRTFFLKVGRSYYRSASFTKSYRFRPISEFGIGILSCFMVASSIEIDTLREESEDGPIHLTIPPWRHYLVTRRGERTSPGTIVTLHLYGLDWLTANNPYQDFLELDKTLGRHVPQSKFGRLIQSIVRHIEFPVEWRAEDQSGEIRDPWETDEATSAWQHLSNTPGVVYRNISPIDENGLVGRIFIDQSHHRRVYYSKYGIGCNKEKLNSPHKLFKAEVDLRGKTVPPLTVDRLRFTANPPMPVMSDCWASLQSAIEKDWDGPIAHGVIESLRRRDWSRSPQELRELRARALCRIGDEIRLVVLGHALAVSGDQLRVWISDVPGREAEAFAADVDIVLPLTLEILERKTRRGRVRLPVCTWTQSLEFIATRHGITISSVNGYEVKTVQASSPCLFFSTGPWAAIRIAPRVWLLSMERTGRLIAATGRHVPRVLWPAGVHHDFEAIVYTGGCISLKSYTIQYSAIPSLPATGAAYVMATLRQHFPDLESDFITNDELPPHDRNRGFGAEVTILGTVPVEV